MKRFSLLLLALLLLAPVAVQAQDPTPVPPTSLCDTVETIDGVATVADAWTDLDGTCAIATGSNLPAWAWLDADLTVYCSAPTGSGTNAVKEGFYMRGTTKDVNGEVSYAGNVTNWVGCTPAGTRSVVHKQLVMQGYDRTITLIVEKRKWPYAADKVVATPDLSRQHVGSVWVH